MIELFAALACLGGHDREALEALTVGERVRLGLASSAGLMACVLALLAVRYAMSLVFDDGVSEWAIGAGVALLLLAMIRIAVSAGGIPLGVRDPNGAGSRWRPGMGPVSVLVVLTWLLAYPVVLWGRSPALDVAVAGLRQHQVDTFRQMNGSRDEAAVEAYGLTLASNGYLGHRLVSEWLEPGDATARALGLLLAVLALHLARTLQFGPVRTYEWVRWQRDRTRVERNYRAMRERRDSILAGHASAAGSIHDTGNQALFRDPPFNTEPRLYLGFVPGRIVQGTSLSAALRRAASKQKSVPDDPEP